MSIGKRIAAWLLMLTLLLTLVPAAFADEGLPEIQILDSPEQVWQALCSDRQGNTGRRRAPQRTAQTADPARRVVLDTDQALSESFAADHIFYYAVGGYYILEYATAEKASQAVERIREENPTWNAFQDRKILLEEETGGATGPYGMELLGLDRLKEEAAGWNGSVTVAVIDSGINTSHELLLDRIDWDNSVNLAVDYSDPGMYEDDQGHGTHVSGIIAQSTPPQVKIMAVRVFDLTGTSSLLTITLGVDYAVEKGAQVLNMSLGQEFVTAEEAAMMNEAFQRGVAAGCVICVASGNEYTDVARSFPASSAWTISVGSLEPAGEGYQRSDFSNYGELLDFVAPGRDIYSSWIGGSGEYLSASGTSMATPFLASQAAYIKLKHPEYSQYDVYATLQDYAVDLGPEGKDTDFGNGYVDLSEYASEDARPGLKRNQAIITDAVIHTSMNALGTPIPISATMSRGDGALSFRSSDETVAIVDDGAIQVVGAGSCEILVTAAETENWKETTNRIQLVVDRGDQEIALEKTSYELTLAGGSVQLGASLKKGDGAITFMCNRTDVLTVTEDGLVTPKKLGTVQIYAVTKATKDYRAATSEPITVTISETLNGAALGDVNGDGAIDGTDLILLARYLANWDLLPALDLGAADMNGDQSVTSADVILLARYLAGWENADAGIS